MRRLLCLERETGLATGYISLVVCRLQRCEARDRRLWNVPQHKEHARSTRSVPATDNKSRDTVQEHLSSNADNTFLWVALVCQDLEKVPRWIPRWKVLARLSTFPPGLDSLYQRMMDQIHDSDDTDLFKEILAIISTVYQPITITELTSFVERSRTCLMTTSLWQIL